MVYSKEVSTSNSNLVLTTAEIHPAPNAGYAKNAAGSQHVPQQFEITFCCPSHRKGTHSHSSRTIHRPSKSSIVSSGRPLYPIIRLSLSNMILILQETVAKVMKLM